MDTINKQDSVAVLRDERRGFEAWWRSLGCTFDLTPDPNWPSGYAVSQVQCAWQAWTAALQYQQAQRQAVAWMLPMTIRNGLPSHIPEFATERGYVERHRQKEDWIPLYTSAVSAASTVLERSLAMSEELRATIAASLDATIDRAEAAEALLRDAMRVVDVVANGVISIANMRDAQALLPRYADFAGPAAGEGNGNG